MNDPFALRTARQRTIVLLAVVTYFGTFLIELTTGDPRAAIAGDLVLAALAIPASIVIAHRAVTRRETDVVAVFAAVAFLVAGVGVGYGGLAGLIDLPSATTVEAIGSLGLLAAVGLYLYHSWA